MARREFIGSPEIDAVRRACTQLEMALMPEGQYHVIDKGMALAALTSLEEHTKVLRSYVEE